MITTILPPYSTLTARVMEDLPVLKRLTSKTMFSLSTGSKIECGSSNRKNWGNGFQDCKSARARVTAPGTMVLLGKTQDFSQLMKAFNLDGCALSEMRCSNGGMSGRFILNRSDCALNFLDYEARIGVCVTER